MRSFVYFEPSWAHDVRHNFLNVTRHSSISALSYFTVQPGDWARFKGLPFRADAAAAIMSMGVGLVRWGGSVNRNVVSGVVGGGHHSQCTTDA